MVSTAKIFGHFSEKSILQQSLYLCPNFRLLWKFDLHIFANRSAEWRGNPYRNTGSPRRFAPHDALNIATPQEAPIPTLLD